MRSYFFSLVFVVAATLSLSASAAIAPNIQREKIAGITVLSYRTGLEDVVFLRGSLPAGSVFDPSNNPVIASLVVDMLDKGTQKQDKFELAAKLERLGASIDFSGGTHEISFSAQCLKADLPAVVALLAEQLRAPAFSAEELAKLTEQRIAGVKRGLENPEMRASLAFSRAVFPEGHPNRGRTAEEQLAGIEAATVADLKKFHAERYGPAHATIVVGGDIDAAALRKALSESFSGWRGGSALPAAPLAVSGGKMSEETVFIPGKTSVSIVWGQATGLRYKDRDTLALRLATAVFGSGFTGRLMANVRDKEGLTYGIGSGLASDTFVDGVWRITASFAPGLLDKGIASTRKQLTLWYDQGITEAELVARKTNLIGGYQVSMATTEGLVEAILAVVQRGYDLSWLDEYPKAIESLTLADVNGAIKKYLNPANMALIKAGTVTTEKPSDKTS